MNKGNKFQIFVAIIIFLLSPFYTWLFGYLSNTVNPIIILYASLSTIFSVSFIFLFTKFFSGLGNKIINIYNDFFYWKDIDKLIEYFEKELKNREIYIIKSEDLAKYIDNINNINKKSDETIYFTDSIKSSTLDCMNRMTDKKILFYVPTLRISILNEILKCEKCGENIKILDKVDHIEIKCEKCNQPYYIDSRGYGIINELDDLITEHKIIYRLKNPNIRAF